MGTQQNSASRRNPDRSAIARWLAVIGLLLALAPAFSSATLAAEQATINVTAVAGDGVTPLPFARFQVVDNTSELITTRETTPPDGVVAIAIDLTDPEMTYTVTMETPPACATKPADQEVGPFTAGDSVDLTFQTSFEDDCVLGGISVYSYTCPSGLDLTIDDYAQYRDNCVETNDGETFTVAEADGDQSFALTTGEYGIAGRAPIVGLLPGDYLVSQDGADTATTLVYCLTFEGTPIEGPAPSDTSHEPLDGDGAVELTLADRGRIACDFFTVAEALPGSNRGDGPVDDQTDDGDVSGAAASASIEFHVATCPSGYDDGDYFNDCAGNGADDVTFTVDGLNTGHIDSATSNVPVNPGFGIAIIDNLPADTFTMSEDVPGDFVSLWVYCADSPGGGERIPTPENGSQQYDIELAEGQAVICDWFITPDQQQAEPAILRLTKFTCEPGYGGSSFADFTGDCTEPTSDVRFNLSNGAGFDTNKTTNNDGKIRYTDVAPGNSYVLTEDLPGDALDNRVAYCATNGADYIEYGVAGDGSIDLDPIADGDQVQCLWYNVPVNQNVGSGTVEIHKSECPPGTDSNFYTICHEDVVGGIGFDVDGPGSYSNSGATNDNGILTFTDLPKGKFTISEVAPAGYPVAIYVVHCTRDGAAFPTTYDDSTGLRVKFDLPAGANIVCDWYNIPEGEATSTPSPGGGTITVITRLCLDDVKDIKDFRDECEMYGAGAEFQLKSVDAGSAQSGKTGNDSRVVFDGLANGAYSLKETSGDWCKAEADHVDASGNVLVQNGGNTNVYIYNCGSRDIHTLPATGIGGGDSDRSTLPLTWWALAVLAAVVLAGGVTLKPVMARHRS